MAGPNNKYCVRRYMFFAVTNPKIVDGLSKVDADELCKNLNDSEVDSTYIHYQVHESY